MSDLYVISLSDHWKILHQSLRYYFPEYHILVELLQDLDQEFCNEEDFVG